VVINSQKRAAGRCGARRFSLTPRVASTLLGGLIAGAALALCSPASAQFRGVDVQVNEGKPVPTVAQFATVLNPQDMVRDILGWAHVDAHCDLAANPDRPIVIPVPMAQLYANVGAAQGLNFVTLAFDNRHCGQASGSGAVDFPNTPSLRAEFAAYAVGVVRQVPALGGISIWNEMNGTDRGGYGAMSQRLTAYCLLVNQVVQAVRAVDKTVPIAIGATIGPGIGTWVTQMFDVYGCVGKNDATIWLDVHPYLNGDEIHGTHQQDWSYWNQEIAAIRADKIDNRLIATEWGGGIAYKWMIAHPHGNYFDTFDEKVDTAGPDWAGLLWFDLLYDVHFRNASLFDPTGTQLTPLGEQYVAAYKH
jgi:hypothetical protein